MSSAILKRIGVTKESEGIRVKAALRRATQTEIPLGQPGFVEDLEAKFHVRLRPLPPGRPPKKVAQSETAPAELAGHARQSA